MKLTQTPAWQALARHAAILRPRHLRELFAVDERRFDRLSLRRNGLLLDYSKQRVTDETMTLLRDLAKTADLAGWQRRMVEGEPINHTEQRAVRHMALRAGDQAPPEVRATLARLQRFCDRIHNGDWRGFSGERISDVVNIGIGGSDLGPRMATLALAARQ